MARREGSPSRGGMFFHQKPQYAEVGETGKVEVGRKREPPREPPKFNYDQLLPKYKTNPGDFPGSGQPLSTYLKEYEGSLDVEMLGTLCRNMTRVMELPALIQNFEGSGGHLFDARYQKEDLLKLLRDLDERATRVRRLDRPQERGVCVGYWKDSPPPFRHAVHATRERRGRLVFRIAETNEAGFYQAPLPRGGPRGIPLPVLWSDVVPNERFNDINRERRQFKLRNEIFNKVLPY